eukprot:6179184-Pleurochrysis_carterae.AAC.1
MGSLIDPLISHSWVQNSRGALYYHSRVTQNMGRDFIAVLGNERGSLEGCIGVACDPCWPRYTDRCEMNLSLSFKNSKKLCNQVRETFPALSTSATAWLTTVITNWSVTGCSSLRVEFRTSTGAFYGSSPAFLRIY